MNKQFYSCVFVFLHSAQHFIKLNSMKEFQFNFFFLKNLYLAFYLGKVFKLNLGQNNKFFLLVKTIERRFGMAQLDYTTKNS